MTKSGPFLLIPFKNFDVEAQEFVLGLGPENFQISVPDGEQLDQISEHDGEFIRKEIRVDQTKIGTSYATSLTPDGGMFFILGSGIRYHAGPDLRRVWSGELGMDRWGPRLDGPVHGMNDGSCVVWVRGRENSDDIQQVRFFQEKGKEQVLLTLPDLTPAGPLDRIYLHDGYVATWASRKWVEGDHAQFYDWEGQPKPHPMARAWNLLHRQKIDLQSPGLTPTWGAFYPSQTKDSWGLFPWKGMPNQADKNLFLLSVTDTVQAVPVTCEKYSLEPQESLTFVLVHPKLNLFLLGARLHRNDDSVMMYIGRVRKDSAGKVYRAETYRVKYFPEFQHIIFSRDGKVLLFAMRDGKQTNLVFAHLDDIVADVNRRYPDAKFDLEELK
jgi:hypothetical protein